MSTFHSAHARFDQFLYWGAFVFIAIFVGYFLDSMIDLANAETEQYRQATVFEYEYQGAIYRERRGEIGSSSDHLLQKTTASEEDLPEY